MRRPGVVGFPLPQALEKARAEGWQVDCQDTRPPWPGTPRGEARVIGERILGEGRVLLICAYEDYEREKERQ